MKSTTKPSHNKEFNDLIAVSKKIGSASLIEAAATDDVNSFPQKTLVQLAKNHLLTASVSSKCGGRDLGMLPGTNLALLMILKNIGSGNLVMGRVLEGHINAQMLINQFGSEKQKKRFAALAHKDQLFGVWNTQAHDGTSLLWKRGGKYQLNGAKIFATGTGYVSCPVVTAKLPDGSWQMCIANMDQDVSVDATWWNPMGMRASRSYKVNFEKSKVRSENLLGKGGDYYEEPGFSGGAVRFATIQLGAAEMLFNETKKYLSNLHRTEDPYQKMRLGKMAVANASGAQWIEAAADHLDHYMKKPSPKRSQELLHFTNMMRTAAETICTEMVILCQQCVGARGLNKPNHFERVIRDLSTYLRQPAPDLALANIGAYVLRPDNIDQ